MGSLLPTELKGNVTEFKKELLRNSKIQTFLNQHSSQISDDIIHRSMSRLNEYAEQNHDCSCTSISECTNLIKGFQPTLVLENGMISVHYKPCEKEIIAEYNRKVQSLVQAFHIPKEIRNASFAHLEKKEDGRNPAILKAAAFCGSYNGHQFTRGLYLHGSFGVGKTYLLGAIANELASKGVPSCIVHWADFLRELKGSFEDNTTNKKVEALKTVPVLMIDDIGSESVTGWVRDDVLGSILQFRMHENLSTFFTSNFNLNELENHFAQTQNGSVESVKAKRIMERIKYLSEAVNVAGKNRRE
ncbi:MAG: dnaI [Bacillales bacterium]|jgi:primosomal protein DnaI|nr:dnaI [Bacillales bacterium]